MIQAAQLAKADPAEAFGQATQAGEQQGFLSRDLRQRLDLLASTDLKTAVERLGQELVPEPETLAQVATREQQASAEDRRQSLAERKFLFETKKWEYEQKAAGNPEFKDIDKIADAFRRRRSPTPIRSVGMRRSASFAASAARQCRTLRRARLCWPFCRA